MKLRTCLETAILPALELLPKRMHSPEALVMLLAIGLQESRLEYRCQILAGGGRGPARGLWQFERGTQASRGGVWGVFLHRSSAEDLRLLCRARDVNYDPAAIWARLEDDDVLAAGVARLLLWTDPKPLPKIGEAQAAWDCYLRIWRPGKPHRRTWGALYAQAMESVV